MKTIFSGLLQLVILKIACVPRQGFSNLMVPAPQHKGQKLLIKLVLSALIAPAIAMADPNIQLEMQVAKLVTLEENGQEVTRWVEAQAVLPGETLKYTVRYVNQGDQPATQVRIENPIPELSSYVADSAVGDGTVIVFSADKGVEYSPPDQVTYEVALFGGGKDRRLAGPERFTHIRWLIERVPPGSSGEVSFQVLVE